MRRLPENIGPASVQKGMDVNSSSSLLQREFTYHLLLTFVLWISVEMKHCKEGCAMQCPVDLASLLRITYSGRRGRAVTAAYRSMPFRGHAARPCFFLCATTWLQQVRRIQKEEINAKSRPDGFSVRAAVSAGDLFPAAVQLHGLQQTKTRSTWLQAGTKRNRKGVSFLDLGLLALALVLLRF